MLLVLSQSFCIIVMIGMMHGVGDITAAEAQYRVRCSDEFRKIPVKDDQTMLVNDEAMKMLVDEMFDNRRLCTWN